MKLKPKPKPKPESAPQSKPERKPRSPANDAPTEKKTPPPLSVELTKITKIGGPLTKRISLAPDGTLVNDGSACVMVRGTAERVKIAGIDALGALIEGLNTSQAIALGTLRAGLPDKVEVTTEKKLVNGVARPDIIARTGANIVYRGPAFALLDFDSKGMPADVAAKLKRVGSFWTALMTVVPALGDVARVTRRSTSSGLSRSDTGKKVPGSDGVHVYVAEKDGGDSERFLWALHDRCWLAGLGWYMVSASGALLERSIVDRMVGGSERLVFEGGPVLVPPLKQDKGSRRPVAVDGGVLDTVTACPPLTIVETAKLEDMKVRERQRVAPEMAKARAKFVGVQAKSLAERTGKPEQDARKVIERQYEGVLHPEVILPFDDKNLSGYTVGDVLADPARFEGETLDDPLEGIDYGRCAAKIMRRSDGTPWIRSFAHGRTIYELKLNAAAVRKAMEAAAKSDVVKTFCRLAVDADLDAEELEDLRQRTKELSGTALGAIDSMLTAARQKHSARRADETRNRQQAARRDPRPPIAIPLPDTPFLPVMGVLNDVIGKVIAAVPPLRDIDGVTTRVRKLPIPNMHAFTQSEANAEHKETTDD